MEKVITANGDYVLDEADGSNARKTGSTSIMIRANTATAVAEFGYGDGDDNFKAFVGGLISTENVINHGKGAKLMVRISGISTGAITILYFPIGD
ncbi:MAG: hypothetical protein GY861_24175 [bacterium]|nr:hypothetical protein [bacterium]